MTSATHRGVPFTLGYHGRAEVLRRMQTWIVENADRVIRTICSETGKAYEDAQIAEINYGAAAFGFWAKHAPKYLADQRVRSSSFFVKGKRLMLRFEPLGLVGRDRPVELPPDQLLRRLHPGSRRRQQRVTQARHRHPAHLAAARRGPCRVRAPGRRLRGPHRARRPNRRRADRQRRHGDVHRLDRNRPTGRHARRPESHPSVAGTGRKGPIDRARRRRHRAGRQPRRLLLDVQLRPDVHLDRALLRRGARLRRVRHQGRSKRRRRSARTRPPARQHRHRVDDRRRAGGNRRTTNPRRGGEGRHHPHRRPPRSHRTGRLLVRANGAHRSHP